MSEYDDMPHPADVANTAVAVPAPGDGQAMTAQPILPVDQLGHGTAIETGRVLAEVQARVIVARSYPRDMKRAEAEMKTSVERIRKPFYDFRRGGKSIHGVTVQVMREAMRCFGNCVSGVQEVRRLQGQSEIMAFAWDLEHNVFQSSTFFVAHERDRSEDHGGAVALESNRDLYEMLAGFAGRREREMIRRILPEWYVQAAEDAAEMAKAGPMEQQDTRIDNAVKVFAKRKITESMLEERFGLPRSGWTRMHLVQLTQLYESMQRGEVTPEVEFPELAAPDLSSAAGTLAQAAAGTTPAAGEPLAAGPEEQRRAHEEERGEGKAKGRRHSKAAAEKPGPPSAGTQQRIVVLLDKIGVKNDQRARTVTALSGAASGAALDDAQQAEVVRKLEACAEGTEDRDVMLSRLAALIAAAETPGTGS